MENKNEVTVHEDTMPAPLSALAIRAQVNLIQGVMKEVMQDGQHYGVIPGCGKKPSLLKPGAEKLSLTFRLRPVMGDGDIDVIDMGNGHREYRIRCHILNSSGMEMATGVGSASTMESKHRYRNVSDYENTDQPIPKDAKEKKSEYRKQGFGMKQIDGVWAWVKYKEADKTENPDIADVYNTVLKMAKKRAYVDGILSATAASDIFTQDLEDIAENHSSAEKGSTEPQAMREPETTEAPKNKEEKKAKPNPPIKEGTDEITGFLGKYFPPKGASKYFAYNLEESPGTFLSSASKDIQEKMDFFLLEQIKVKIFYDKKENIKDGKTYINRYIVSVEEAKE